MYDPIVAEVRRIREEIAAEFDYDITKYHAYLDSQKAELDAAGFKYETEEKRQQRFEWNKQQREELERKLAAV
jgi:hypothetical protein